MTLQDRIEIQECLSKGMTFKAIARRVGKSPTTISREVKQHATWQHNGFVKTDKECPLLLKAPFVCNNCSKKTNFGCVHPRRTYIAKHAHMEYRTVLVEAREGIPLTKEEFYQHEKVISDAVRAGQHIFHAINATGCLCPKPRFTDTFTKDTILLHRLICPEQSSSSPEPNIVPTMFLSASGWGGHIRIILPIQQKTHISILLKWILS